MSATPEITVGVSAVGEGPRDRELDEAIEHALRQDGVDFEVVVVGKGEARAAWCADSSVRWHPCDEDDAHWIETVVRMSRAPRLLFLDSRCRLLPGALERFVRTPLWSDTVQLLHGYTLFSDCHGAVLRVSAHESWHWSQRTFSNDIDYASFLVERGADGIFPWAATRTVFESVGRVVNRRGHDVTLGILLRALDQYEMRAIPEMLAWRTARRGRALVERFSSWRKRHVTLRDLRRRGVTSCLAAPRYGLRLSTRALAFALGTHRGVASMSATLEAVRCRFEWRVASPVRCGLYRLVAGRVHRWPVRFGPVRRPGHNLRIGYWLWKYPVRSETFVQREIAALRQAGLSVSVISETSAKAEFLDEYRETLSPDVTSVLPIDPQRLRAYRRYFRRRVPLRYWHLRFYVLCLRYQERKVPAADAELFARAVYVAGIAQEKKINHLHAPWADACTLRTMIAARLLDIPYSVQARAIDVHERRNRPGLEERIRQANLVVTNCRYNELYLKSLLDPRDSVRMEVIYNGLDLARFDPVDRKLQTEGPFRIVCVGRIAEQKGITHLLEACALLRQQGFPFSCDIIGGDEPTEMSYAVRVRRLMRDLELSPLVRFLGLRSFEAILDYYREADLVVLPCVIDDRGGRDVTPNVLLEAMAMGVPVISTQLAGLPEIVEDGVSGMLVPPGDSPALAQAMASVLRDPVRWRRFSKEGRRRIEKRFNRRRNIPRYLELFGSPGALEAAEPDSVEASMLAPSTAEGS